MSSVEAKGWFCEFVKTQMEGLTGYIEKAGYPFNVVNKACVFTPRLLCKNKLQLDDKAETIRLYPYGACKLRVTVFNNVK